VYLAVAASPPTKMPEASEPKCRTLKPDAETADASAHQSVVLARFRPTGNTDRSAGLTGAEAGCHTYIRHHPRKRSSIPELRFLRTAAITGYRWSLSSGSPKARPGGGVTLVVDERRCAF